MKSVQTTFIDGLDMLASDYQVSQGGYQYLINARQRLGRIKPINKPREVAGLPSGKKQGIIAIGNINIAFIAGKAYYNVDGSSAWLRILQFAMSSTVDKYWSIDVPAGTVNYNRKLQTSGDAAQVIRKMYDVTIDGTPAAILVQDGINQPWVIIYDETSNSFSARVTQDYDEWDVDGIREYVPIGRQMCIVDEKLLIQSVDKKKVYQSVSGRYLDFMVNITADGDKLPTEAQGGALSVSYAFDADEITCLTASDIPSSFIYGTKRNVRIITLDYTFTLFGEPRPYVSAIVEVGAVNQDSVVDILGDFAIVDFEGVKSFNAVKQLQNEGNNSIFSLQLTKLLDGVKQRRPIAINFDNYSLFNLDTTFGNIIIVFDNILRKWVALDITEAFAIKEFSIVETTTERKLYAITESNKMFQLYSSDTETEAPQLKTRAFVAQGQDGSVQVMYGQKSEILKLYFHGGTVDGYAYVSEYVDGESSIFKLKKELPAHSAGFGFPMTFPITFSNKPTSEPITFNLRDGKKGHRIHFIIQWDTDATLQAIELQTADDVPVVSKLQQERSYVSNGNG